MKITFLGTGTSHGVPPIDCMITQYAHCPQNVCREATGDPKHQRTRSSLLIEWEGASLLVDIGPDFRQQCLREKVTHINAVLITHAHADHIFGLPDIRSYTRNSSIPLYGSAQTISRIHTTFAYMFDPHTPVGGGIPDVVTHAVDEPFTLFNQTITPVRVNHLGLDGCFGYRIGPAVYIPDMKSITESELEKLKGCSVLILNCLRRGPHHPSHLTLEQSVAMARRIAPEHCYFIHMSHDIHYKLDRASLDPWMDFSWDGLRIEIPDHIT